MRLFRSLPALVLIAALAACTRDNLDDLRPFEPQPPADTVPPTFTAHIKPILENRCYACHANDKVPMLFSTYPLDTYAHVLKVVNNGKLLKSIRHETGAVPMPFPPNSPKIPAVEIDRIARWISNGSPEN